MDQTILPWLRTMGFQTYLRYQPISIAWGASQLLNIRNAWAPRWWLLKPNPYSMLRSYFFSQQLAGWCFWPSWNRGPQGSDILYGTNILRSNKLNQPFTSLSRWYARSYSLFEGSPNTVWLTQPFTKVHLFFWANPLHFRTRIYISNFASNHYSTTNVDVLIVKHSFLAGKNRTSLPNMVQSHFFRLVKRRRCSILICWVKFCSTSDIGKNMDLTSFLNDEIGYPNI